MTRLEAEYECRRWLAHLDKQKARSIAVQRLASERRAGVCDIIEGRERLAMLDRGVTVYDGARLAEAVGILLGTPGSQASDEIPARPSAPVATSKER